MTLSAYHIIANKIRIASIAGIETVSPTVKVFTFKDRICSRAKPGQFIMLWITGVDEIPFSVMDAASDGTISVAIKNVGEATACLHRKKVGELIGVRGPFGNSFSAKKSNILMVGGGTGIAPLFFLSNRLNARSKATFIMGAKTQDELILKDKLEARLKADNIIATTEDGSCGITGLCTEPSEQLLSKHKFDMIYSCGSEKMLQKVFELAEKHETEMEASLERLMRCAVGLCGSCVIGKYRVCADGPVFNSSQLREVANELGISKRGFDGRKIALQE